MKFTFSRTVFACSAVASVLGALTMVACTEEVSSPLPTKAATTPPPVTTTEEPTNPDDKPPAPTTADGGGTKTCSIRAPGDGPYCPFQARTDADAGRPSLNCAAGESCCSFTSAQGAQFDGGFPNVPAYCATSCEPTPPVPTGMISQPFECNAPEHCGTGTKCCLFPKAGSPGLSINSNANKCPSQSFGRVGGSACRDTCDTGETPVCSKNSDCPSGSTCSAISATGRDMGYCK